MPLSATQEAIGAVSEALRAQLALRTSVLVTVSRPDQAALSEELAKLNLFLYQIDFDPFLKNVPLDADQPPPLWLTLRYLLTAFDQDQDSASVAAHRLLARGLAALQEMNVLSPTVPALIDNPEPLKLTFDHCDTDLLSKIMQGSDERYRLSAAFQVRPVLIAAQLPPAYAPPVLTVGPPGAEGVVVLPSPGPQLASITPHRFAGGALLELRGDGIGPETTSAFVGGIELPVITARAGAVQVRIPADPPVPAGYHPVSVTRRLPSGRLQSSNPLLGTLLPTVTGAVVGALTPNGSRLFGSVTINGSRLGGPDDLIIVAFYREGQVALSLETPGTAAQSTLVASVDAAHALPPGEYYLIVRVNGVQATVTPRVDWVI